MFSEYVLIGKESRLWGVWDIDGGFDWRNDVGDEGGVIKGRNIEVELFEEFWIGVIGVDLEVIGLGISIVWLICLLFFCDLKY